MRFPYTCLLATIPLMACQVKDEKKDSATTSETTDNKTDSGEAADAPDDGMDGGTEGGTTGDTVATGQVALGFPEDLVVVSPYSTETAALAEEANAAQATIKSGNVAVASLTDQASPTYKQEDLKGFAMKRAFLSSLVRNVSSDDGCMFKPAPPKGKQTLCYGPRIVFKDHPDGPDTPPTLPPNDLGFWLASEPIEGASPAANEPCMTAKTSEIVDEISSRVDNATGTAAMFLCFARRDNKSLPENGKTLDLQPYADKARAKLPADAPEFTGVSMSRADVDGKAVYTTKFRIKEQFANLTGNAKNHSFDVEIVHKPTGENNSSYTGYVKMLVALATPPTTSTTCGGSQRDVSQNGYHAVSVSYLKEEETRVAYEFRGGHFPYATNTATLFDAKGYAKIPSGSDCALGGELAIYETNPTSGQSKLAYSWFAGNAVEQVRTLVSEVDVVGTGASAYKQGCGYYGYGEPWNDVAAERAAPGATGKMTKMLTQFACNWAGPGSMPNRVFHQKVQRQCAKQDATTGYFAPHPDTTNYGDYISYSPQNSCVRAGGEQLKTCIQPENVNTCPGGGAPTELSYNGAPSNPLLSIAGWDATQKAVLYSPPVFTP